MNLQKRHLSKLTRMALQNQKNFIQMPVEPQPVHKFERIRVSNGLAAFWLNSSCCELRNCPWGKPGTLFKIGHTKLEITHIEIKPLQESILPSVREKRTVGRTNADEQFIMLWNRLFAKTDYIWDKDPLVWLIYFQKNLFPAAIPFRRATEDSVNSVVSLPDALAA